MNTRDITNFFEHDAIDFASYDNIRKISGFDGLKMSQRKLVWTGFKRCREDFIKTEIFANQTVSDTAYIHGATNLAGVVDSLAASYVTSNNYPLFLGNTGGFGCRISPRPSAPRYTRVRLSDITKSIFKEVDNSINDQQYFEGQYIEPKYLLPIFPILFLNGANGISTGFSQSIYPRNPKVIVSYIKDKITGNNTNKRYNLLPWFRNFKGVVRYNKDLNVNECCGVINKIGRTTFEITELPVEISYQKMIDSLDKMEDDGIIQSYIDKCDPKTDNILFEVKTSMDFVKTHTTTESLLKAFRLIRQLPEVFNCIDENNRVHEFKSIEEILNNFIDVRLKFYDIRKKYLCKKIKDELIVLVSKLVFISSVLHGTLIINNTKKEKIITQLEKIPKINKVDGSYDFLLSMKLYSLTSEKIEDLKVELADKKLEYEQMMNTNIQDMWVDDLSKFSKLL